VGLALGRSTNSGCRSFWPTTDPDGKEKFKRPSRVPFSTMNSASAVHIGHRVTKTIFLDPLFLPWAPDQPNGLEPFNETCVATKGSEFHDVNCGDKGSFIQKLHFGSNFSDKF
jgi:hypothetical protein